jgi:hypothetical protein
VRRNGYWIFFQNGAYYFQVGKGDADYSFWNAEVTADSSWTHIAGTFTKDGQICIYKNGVFVQCNNVSGGIVSLPSTKAVLGAYKDGLFTDAWNFNGMEDDVKVYNYVRTPAQIAWDYNRGKPVGYWKFDECQGTTANDSSGNGNTGAINIGATVPQTTAGTCTTPADGTGAWYNGKSGKFNSAMSFDGVDDYVDAGDNGTTDMGFSNFTVEGWIKTSSSGGGYGRLVDKSFATGFSVFVRSGTIGMAIANLYNLNARSGAATITDNQWHHVAVVFNRNGNAVFYVDGHIDGAATDISSTSAVDLNNATNFKIGNGTTGDSPFAGLIDDVKIYNYALTQQQVLLDYNQGAAVRFGPATGRP